MPETPAGRGTPRATIRPASGKLGVLTPGLGAVATTFIAGVESIRRGLSKPIGSLTQMATIRLGKRTDKRSPLIRDFVPLAALDDLVFGAWDPIPDDAYTAATKAGVLEQRDLEPIADFLRGIKPMPAVFDQVRHAHNGEQRQAREKQARPRRAAAAGHSRFQSAAVRPTRDGLVRVDRDVHQAGAAARDARGSSRSAMEENDDDDRAVDALRVGVASWKACRIATARRT